MNLNVNSKVEVAYWNSKKLVVKKYNKEDLEKFKRELYFYKFNRIN